MNTEEKNGLKILEQAIDRYNMNRDRDTYAEVFNKLNDYGIADYDNVYVPIQRPDRSDKEIIYDTRNGFDIYPDDFEYLDLLGIDVEGKLCIPVYTSELFGDIKRTDTLMEISLYALLLIMHGLKDDYFGIVLNPEWDENKGCLIKMDGLDVILENIENFLDNFDYENVGVDVVCYSNAEKHADVIVDASEDMIIGRLYECNIDNQDKTICIDFSDMNIDCDDSELIDLIRKMLKIYDNRNAFVLNAKDEDDMRIIDGIVSKLMDIDNEYALDRLKEKYS